MLTELERKEIGRIPFIAHRRRSRLTFMPILIAFCAMTTILCLLSLFFHSTLPESELRTNSSLPPRSDAATTRIAGVPDASPLLFPMLQ